MAQEPQVLPSSRSIEHAEQERKDFFLGPLQTDSPHILTLFRPYPPTPTSAPCPPPTQSQGSPLLLLPTL
eukprot:763497-Hanusia_phi.AAC.1